MRRLFLTLLAALLIGAPAQAREAVDASPPRNIAVTIYRDPTRGPYEEMNRNWPQGFAMITETRQVTLPPGESTIRFAGVSEGMVAVSAIVTGLPGGTVEKNRNADLLSPAALIDGTLGNRVTITRTNPATGTVESESAVVRTRADGGLVLQTSLGFEAVRCSGLPERLTFERVPDGLSPAPVFSIDTADPRGGTYTVELTYLSWGFDWQANYVATLEPGGRGDAVELHLLSWLTLLNDNGQSFENAELLTVAGTLNVESDFRALADPPRARPLRLTCYPLGSSLAGSPVEKLLPPPPPPPPAPMMMEAMEDGAIVVTGARASAPAITAAEEQLGDLKLYRFPDRIDVRAKGLKQIAFLDRDEVRGRLLYTVSCDPWTQQQQPVAAEMLFVTVNDRAHGLGQALPTGTVAFFESTAHGDLLAGEHVIRDHAEGQDVEMQLGDSSQVFARCARSGGEPHPAASRWSGLELTLSNANSEPASIRIYLGAPRQIALRGIDYTLRDGQRIAEIRVPGNASRTVTWEARTPG